MKTINAIIIGLLAALAFSSYLLAVKLFPKTEPTAPESAQTASSRPAEPAPVARIQSNPQPNMPAVPVTSPQPAVSRSENPISQNKPPAPAVKEEPKQRPVRDIKVVMYMTDW
jgi:hypothetical protein